MFCVAEDKGWLLKLHVETEGMQRRQDSFAVLVFHLGGIDVCFCLLDA